MGMLKASWKRWCQSYKISFFWIFSMLKKRLVILIHWLHEWRGRRSEGSSICFEGIDLNELWRAGCKPPGAKSFVMETARLLRFRSVYASVIRQTVMSVFLAPRFKGRMSPYPHPSNSNSSFPSLSLIQNQLLLFQTTDNYCKCFRIHRIFAFWVLYMEIHYGSMLFQLRSGAWDAEPDQEDDGLEP